jgi:subtilisin family serine protease
MGSKRVRSLSLLTAALLVAGRALPAAAQDPTTGTEKLIRSADPVGGLYVVLLAGPVDPAKVAPQAADLAAKHGGQVTHVYIHAVTGFAIETTEESALALSREPGVELVQEAGVFKTSTTQPNPPWGLDRIDQRDLPLSGAYTYGRTGQGVKAFVIDTGIYAQHQDFGGRAVRLADVIGGVTPPGNDCHGHGTHVSGTLGGATFGVAKGVTLYGVRVLDCSGSGTTASVVAGVDFVTSYVVSQNARPAVVNMSLGGPADSALDAAVRNSIARNITYSIAAGNSSANASGYSPARVGEALTVAASAINDAWASFSNYGSVIDVIAPGVDVLSAGHTSPTATAVFSGTSMAAPHVAGAAAVFLESNPSATPGAVASWIASTASGGRIRSVPAGTVNRLLFSQAPPPPPPSDLQVTSVGSTQVSLAWQDRSDNETGFSLERRELPSGGWGARILPRDTESFVDYGLTPATSYAYRVQAFNGDGNSDYSNEATATTLGIPPAPVAIEPYGCGTTFPATLRWTTVVHATSYRVTVLEVGNPTPVYEATPGTPPLVVPGLVAGRRYSWTVRGRNSALEEGPSSTPRVFTSETCRLYIGDAQGGEGSGANGVVQLTVSLSPADATSRTITVQYQTLDGSARSGADYTPAAGTLTFPPGTVSQQVAVVTIGDVMDEYHEDAFVRLSNPTGAVLERGQGRALILDDDDPPSLSVLDAGATEGGVLYFSIVLSARSGKRIEVNHATANGVGPAAAIAPLDYPSVSGRVVFEPEIDPADPVRVVAVPSVADATDEYDEHFLLNVAPLDESTVSGGSRQARGTIRDDDPPPSLRVPEAAAREGRSGTSPLAFDFFLLAASEKTVEVAYATRDDSANAGSDYLTASGVVRFPPAAVGPQRVTVQLVGDDVYERPEGLWLDLSGNPADVALPSPPRARGTILNDDPSCTKVTALPYVVRTPGVYCLDRDLATDMVSGAAIEIAADHVVLDLGGYSIRRSPADMAWTATVGVFAHQRSHVTIRNGTIQGFFAGIYLQGSPGGLPPYDQGHLVEDVRADWNSHVGIWVEGAGSTVRSCSVLGTGGTAIRSDSAGIRVRGMRAQVLRNQVAHTSGPANGSGHGIEVDGAGVVVEGNRVGNASGGGTPSFGISVLGTDSLVVGNRLALLGHGVHFAASASGKYRDNVTVGVSTPYQGGTDAGNNQ